MMGLVRLGDVCEVVSGATPRRDNPAYWNGDVPWVTPKELADLDGPQIGRTEEQITEAGFKSCSTRMLPPGAVLFSSRAPIGHVAIATIAMCTNQGFKSLVPSPEVDSAYLYWVMKWSTPTIEARASGTTFKEVSKAEIEDVKIPLPPLHEQRRIAAILDEADALRRKRREALGLLDELLRSAFLEMFGDPVTNPRGWPQRKLREVIANIEPGWSASGTDRPAAPGEWGVLKVSAVSTGHFLPDENKMVASPQFAKSPIVPRRGDLLFSRANTRELVAATCLVDTDSEGIFLPDKLWRISCFAEVAVVEWLRFLLANEAFRRTLTKQATGTSGSMLNVSQDKLLDLVAPVPPVVDQRRFASLVWATIEERRRIASSDDAVEDMFDALLHRAFAGDQRSHYAI